MLHEGMTTCTAGGNSALVEIRYTYSYLAKKSESSTAAYIVGTFPPTTLQVNSQWNERKISYFIIVSIPLPHSLVQWTSRVTTTGPVSGGKMEFTFQNHKLWRRGKAVTGWLAGWLAALNHDRTNTCSFVLFSLSRNCAHITAELHPNCQGVPQSLATRDESFNCSSVEWKPFLYSDR